MDIRRWLPLGALLLVPLVLLASLYAALNRAPSRPFGAGSVSGLVAHWTFQGSFGGRVVDAAGGHDAQLYAPQWDVKRSAFGAPALLFDGERTYAEVLPAPELRFEGSFTIAAWVNVVDPRARQALLHKADPGGDLRRAPVTFYVPWGEGRLGLVLSRQGKRVGFLSDERISRGWHPVAVTYDRETGEIRFYLDGELAGERVTSWRPAPGQDGPLYIGLAGSPQRAWHRYRGGLLSLRIYSRALSGGEVEALAERRPTSSEAEGETAPKEGR